mgnify:CR=1 FL=1
MKSDVVNSTEVFTHKQICYNADGLIECCCNNREIIEQLQNELANRSGENERS